MEGPTPVSALIHAATMVTAGVYLLLRLSFIIEYTVNVKIIISFIGSLSIIFGSLSACFQNDIKSIIAYSTCSQLGYMVVFCGIGAYNIALYHLINHGFFKALLFLVAGSIIHALYEEQDIRKMGGLFAIFPLSYCFFILGSMSLIGFPFFSGYYSKDSGIELLYMLITPYDKYLYYISVVGILFTSFYSFRVIYMAFIRRSSGTYIYYKNAIEAYSIEAIVGLSVLSVGGIVVGYFFSDIFVGIGSMFFSDSILINVNIGRAQLFLEFSLINQSFLTISLKVFPFLFIVLGLLFYFVFYAISFNVLLMGLDKSNKLKLFSIGNYIRFFFYSGFFFNHVYFSYVYTLFIKIVVNMFLFEK
jgi:NADH-ubiquinone oxidoreductase chain 5